MSAVIDRFVNWEVSFPNSPDFYMSLLNAELTQKQESHDVLVLQFKGSIERHTKNEVKQGDPIKFVWYTRHHTSTFVGFVHAIEKDTTLGNTFTKVIAVNNSEILKKTGKELFKNQTPDSIVSYICGENRLTANTTLYPYSYPTVAQAGQSYWQLFRRLAKATGFALRAENTEVIFQDQDRIIADKLSTAPVFVHFTMGPMGLAAQQTLISFTALDSKNAPELNQGDLGISVSGTDGNSYTFNRGHSVTNGSSFMNPVSLPSNWQETYGVVPSTTIDGLGS